MITTFIFLNPKLTLRTLLCFYHIFQNIYDLTVILFIYFVGFVLNTSHSTMHLNTAIKTEAFFAFRTFMFRTYFHKCITTIRFRTQTHIIGRVDHPRFHNFQPSFEFLLSYNLPYFGLTARLLTLYLSFIWWSRTLYLMVVFVNFLHKIRPKTCNMDHTFTCLKYMDLAFKCMWCANKATVILLVFFNSFFLQDFFLLNQLRDKMLIKLLLLLFAWSLIFFLF